MVIRARNVTLALGTEGGVVDILRGINLDVEPQKHLAILGPSGSGKSSLLSVLTGLERASGGSVEVGGVEFSGLGEDELAEVRRTKIGIILQAFHLIPTMTALENVAVPLELSGQKNAKEQAAAELQAVGLARRAHHFPTQLSGGEQQRVAIARALASRPAILFADEPTGNLDIKTGDTIINLLFERLEETGATLVLITHDQQLARRCQRIIHMLDGLIQDGAPQ